MAFTIAYTRVSTADQTAENQLGEIKQAGYEPDATYVDAGVSGKVRAMDRPEFSQALDFLSRLNEGRHKRLVVTKLDRIGRDAEDVLRTVRELGEKGVEVIVLQLGTVDLASAMGRMIMTTLSAVAELERGMIVERTKSGLERAKSEGKTLGRPRALSEAQETQVREELAQGATIYALAKRFDVSRSAIRRLKNDHE